MFTILHIILEMFRRFLPINTTNEDSLPCKDDDDDDEYQYYQGYRPHDNDEDVLNCLDYDYVTGSNSKQDELDNVNHYDAMEIHYNHDNEDSCDCAVESDSKLNQPDVADVTFSPPLYRQRYWTVANLLEENNIKSVVDFGCAECKVLRVYKGCECLEQITGVDIDKDLLMNSRPSVKPLTADYLVKRERPLCMRLFCGSAGTYDARLRGTEAVTMIEIIEHLYDDILQQVAYNVFVNIRPRLVIMTTPNSEYNVLFPGMTGFRHWDHKFEWTREQFQDWCDAIATEHDYSVLYSGIGDPPADQNQLGFCSQMAVFRINTDWSANTVPKPSEEIPYELVVECEHPYQQCKRSLEESVVMDTEYYLQMLTNQNDEYDTDNQSNEAILIDTEQNLWKVSLPYLLRFSRLQKLSIDVQKYSDVLDSQGYKLTEDKMYVLHTPVTEESSTSDEGSLSDQPQDMEPTSNEGRGGWENLNEETWTENWDSS